MNRPRMEGVCCCPFQFCNRFWQCCLGSFFRCCRTSLCVGCCVEPKRPTWNKRFEITVDVARSVAFSIDPNHSHMRLFLDRDVPTFTPGFPIMPRGAGLKHQRGEQLLSTGTPPTSTSEAPIYNYNLGFEWIYHEKEGAPWDEKTNTMDQSLRRRKIILYFHGGAFVFGTRGSHRMFLYHLAAVTGCTILTIEYRKSPEFAYPVPPLDCFEAYKWLISNVDSSSQIFVAGDSAGGALVTETLVRARDSQIPLPSAGILLSPWVDIFNISDLSFTNNKDFDIIPDYLATYCASIYYPQLQASATTTTTTNIDSKTNANNNCSSSVHPSVIDLSLSGLPPLFIAAGESEVLCDQIVRFADVARSQNVSVDLRLYADMPHVFQLLVFTQLKTCFESFNDIKIFIQKFDDNDHSRSLDNVHISLTPA